MSKIFTQLPEELFNHTLWKKCSVLYKWCFIAILRRAAFTDQPKLGIKKGQVKISAQQCQDDVYEMVGIKIPRTTSWRAIKHFMGINSHKKVRGDGAALLQLYYVKHKVEHEVKQELKHENQVYNILLKGYYEICETTGETRSETESGTAGETEVKQRWNSFPRENEHRILEAKNLKESTTSKNEEEPEKKMMVVDFLFAKGFSEDQKNGILKTYKAQIVWLALQHIYAPGYIITQTPIQALKWACRDKPWEWSQNQPKKLSNREWCEQFFQDGSKYNNATCEINATEISFHRGMVRGGARFDDKMFKQNLAIDLKKLGIAYPQEKITNIKEA
jgi:hypothetical protein